MCSCREEKIVFICLMRSSLLLLLYSVQSTKYTHTQEIVHQRQRLGKKGQSNCVSLHIDNIEWTCMCAPLAGSCGSINDKRFLRFVQNRNKFNRSGFKWMFWESTYWLIFSQKDFYPKWATGTVFRFSFSTATICNEFIRMNMCNLIFYLICLPENLHSNILLFSPSAWVLERR